MVRIMPEGIRTRLFLLIALVLLPLILLLGWIYYQRHETMVQKELRSQVEMAEVIAANFRTYVESIQRQSHITGHVIIGFDVYTVTKANAILSDIMQYPQGIRNMSWVAVDGTVLASSQPDFIGLSLGHRGYFQEVVKGKEWAIGDLTMRGTITPAPTIAIATAIRDEIGFLRGIVVTGIEPERLSEASLIKMQAENGYTIFDSRGVVVFRCPAINLSWAQRTGWIREDWLLQETMKTRKPQAGFVTIPLIGREQWVAARVYIPEIAWFAGTGRPSGPAFRAIWVDMIQDTSIAAVVCGAAFLLAFLFSRTISTPIRRLRFDATKMGRGEIQRFDDPYAPQEVQNLREQVEDMATDLITRAQQLADLTNDLKNKNGELESIISITSHDLKSPVVNIMGFSSELDRSLKTLKEKLTESHVSECRNQDIMRVLESEIPEEVRFIQKSTRSIGQMLESLSKVVNIVLSEIRISRVNVRELIVTVVTTFDEQIRTKGVKVTVETMPECLGDPTLLREIFFNLIENAIIYLEPGRPGLVTIGGSIRNQYAIYYVKDNGRGIAPAHQHNIFKLFHKLDVSEEGEGIGLTVSKRLAERQSGNMWVESEPGVGSTFYVALPKA